MRARILFAGILGLAVAAVLPAAAQITITASDVTSTFALGRVSYQYTDTTATSLDIGSPGASSWDFRSLRMDVGGTLTSVAPGSTPYSGDFPGATHAFQTLQTMEGFTLTIYQYFTLATNLLNPGTKGGAASPFGDIVYSLVNSPAATVYALPSTLGTTWNTSYAETNLISLGGFPIVGPTVTNYAESYTVDGYGPMTMRGGTVYQALRIRYQERSPDLSIGYIFIAKEGAIVTVSSPDTAATSGVVQVDGVSWISPIAVSVPTDQPAPTSYALAQNYPNPFNPSTEIAYQVPTTGRVRLSVYNLLGEEMAVLVDDVKSPGAYRARFNAAGFASGVYIYRLEAGSFVQARRMLLVR